MCVMITLIELKRGRYAQILHWLECIPYGMSHCLTAGKLLQEQFSRTQGVVPGFLRRLRISSMI